MLRSELLEREAEARRIELAETFDELRARATPGHVLNKLVDYATESGGANFFRNLRDQSVANPLALGLVGAGLAWLMMSNGRERRAYDPYAEDYYDTEGPRSRMRGYIAATRERAGDAASGARDFVSDTAAGVRDRVAGAAHMASDAAGSVAYTARSARDAALGVASSVGETVSSVGGQARSRAGDATAAVGDATSALYGGVSQAAGRTASGARAFASGTASGARALASGTASGARAFASGTASTGRDVFDFARDQPLVLAGLGLAFGAAMGAAFPATERERQLMGEASDDLKERTQAFAAANYEKSRSMAEAVYDEFQHRIQEGSSGRSAAGHTSIVPLDEQEATEIQETNRQERIGRRGDRR
jgi:hypothetical protein